MAAGRRATVTLGEAEYDLTNFAHPGGQLAMFGVSNSSDPLGLMYQYHEFSAERLASILAPHCISASTQTDRLLLSTRPEPLEAGACSCGARLEA